MIPPLSLTGTGVFWTVLRPRLLRDIYQPYRAGGLSVKAIDDGMMFDIHAADPRGMPTREAVHNARTHSHLNSGAIGRALPSLAKDRRSYARQLLALYNRFLDVDQHHDHAVLLAANQLFFSLSSAYQKLDSNEQFQVIASKVASGLQPAALNPEERLQALCQALALIVMLGVPTLATNVLLWQEANTNVCQRYARTLLGEQSPEHPLPAGNQHISSVGPSDTSVEDGSAQHPHMIDRDGESDVEAQRSIKRAKSSALDDAKHVRARRVVLDSDDALPSDPEQRLEEQPEEQQVLKKDPSLPVTTITAGEVNPVRRAAADMHVGEAVDDKAAEKVQTLRERQVIFKTEAAEDVKSLFTDLTALTSWTCEQLIDESGRRNLAPRLPAHFQAHKVTGATVEILEFRHLHDMELQDFSDQVTVWSTVGQIQVDHSAST